MKIWFNINDLDATKFCSEQMLVSPYIPLNVIQSLPDYADIHTYIDNIKQMITLVSNVNDCDYIVYPRKLENTELLHDYIDMGLKYDKKIICFFNDDISDPITATNLIIFRTSMYKSKQNSYEHAMPAWSIDFKPHIQVRTKKDTPTVGFCGFINHHETNIRRRALNEVSGCKNINTNIIVRTAFWGGKVHDNNIRREYIKNMQDSDFVLCARGAGNFSYRLYEALSMGKIPLFIDTDCVLPFDQLIDYNAYFPIIKENEMYTIETVISDYWNNIVDYNETQHTLRKLYEDYLSPVGFIKTLTQELIRL